jgi:hypothetical protein
VAWSQRLAPWGHFTVFTVMAALAWVLREHGPTQLSPSLRAVVWCEDAAAGSGTCAAMTDKQAVWSPGLEYEQRRVRVSTLNWASSPTRTLRAARP